MTQVLTPGLRLQASTRITKTRELPVRGDTRVTIGDVVRSSDRVAEASLPGELHLLRIPEKLGLEPFEVMKGLRVREGDRVETGTLLCEYPGLFGWFKSRYLSPVAGIVELVTEKTGHLAVRGASTPLTLDAYISGVVTAVEEGRSVTIETTGALVQGIFGVGGERHGVLRLLDVSPETPLTEAMVPAVAEGLVLVGGTAPSAAVLRCATERGARGFVVGAIDDRALSAYLGYDLGIALTGDEDISMSLVVTEGFGAIPLSTRILQLLRPLDGKEVSLNGATQVRAGAVRPELIVPHSVGSPSVNEGRTEGLAVGQPIRIIRVPYFGVAATITDLPPTPERIETGAFARVLRASLADGRVITVPRANVELLE
jgi:hypothetical protein